MARGGGSRGEHYSRGNKDYSGNVGRTACDGLKCAIGGYPTRGIVSATPAVRLGATLDRSGAF